jgi:hypothetical protein
LHVVSPLENQEFMSETYDPLDEQCEDEGKVARDVEVNIQNFDRDIALPNQQRMEQNVGRLMNLGGTMQKDIEVLLFPPLYIPPSLSHLPTVSDTSQVFRQDSRIRDLTASPPSLSPSIRIPQPQRAERQRPKLFIEDTPSPPFSSREFFPRPPTPYQPRAPRRSFSTSETYSPHTSSSFGSPPVLSFHNVTQSQPQSPPQNSPQNTSQDQNLDLAVLKTALKVIRTQLTLLDTGIKTNIAEQLKLIPSSPTSSPDGRPIVVLDPESLPSFKAEGGEKMDRRVGKALLDTVKVCCVVERGLEGVIGVLEDREKEKEWDGREGKEGKEENLMNACLEKSKAVRREMRSALKGIEGVVGFDGMHR